MNKAREELGAQESRNSDRNDQKETPCSGSDMWSGWEGERPPIVALHEHVEGNRSKERHEEDLDGQCQRRP